MSHSHWDHAVFSNAREWRRIRATVAANARHRNDDRAQKARELLAVSRYLGQLRAIVDVAPGVFELGTEYADWFYDQADQWISAFAAGGMR